MISASISFLEEIFEMFKVLFDCFRRYKALPGKLYAEVLRWLWIDKASKKSIIVRFSSALSEKLLFLKGNRSIDSVPWDLVEI